MRSLTVGELLQFIIFLQEIKVTSPYCTQCPILLNARHPKPHFAFKLGRLSLPQVRNEPTTAKGSLMPARLTILVCQQAGLTNGVGRKKLTLRQHYQHGYVLPKVVQG